MLICVWNNVFQSLAALPDPPCLCCSCACVEAAQPSTLLPCLPGPSAKAVKYSPTRLRRLAKSFLVFLFTLRQYAAFLPFFLIWVFFSFSLPKSGYLSRFSIFRSCPCRYGRHGRRRTDRADARSEKIHFASARPLCRPRRSVLV